MKELLIFNACRDDAKTVFIFDMILIAMVFQLLFNDKYLFLTPLKDLQPDFYTKSNDLGIFNSQYSVMRVHVIIEELSIEFWINDIPELPRKDDHIDFSSMYQDGSQELTEIFQKSTFMVESVTWAKDKDGYLAMLFCELTK